MCMGGAVCAQERRRQKVPLASDPPGTGVTDAGELGTELKPFVKTACATNC